MAGARQRVHGAPLVAAKSDAQHQRRSTGSPTPATADASVESTGSQALAAALHRIRWRCADDGTLSRTWVFHDCTICCFDIRLLTALVCSATIVINLMLLRMQLHKDQLAQQHCESTIAYHGASEAFKLSTGAASNCFSIFAYAVGLLAVWRQNGSLGNAFFCYAAADTLFALLPETLNMIALGIHPDTVFANGPAGEGGRQLLASMLTLSVNFMYNMPCLFVSWTYADCFEAELSTPSGPDNRSLGSNASTSNDYE